MGTIRAIYENGVFRPINPVELPERCEVDFDPRLVQGTKGREVAANRVRAILGESYEATEPAAAGGSQP